MQRSTLTALAALALLLAAAGTASADPCPDCRTNVTPTNDCGYWSAGGGAVENGTRAAGDSDLCVANAHHPKGVWANFRVCLHAVLEKVGALTGLRLDARSDVYASQDGVDVDAGASALDHKADFDRSPVGKLDDLTWGLFAKVNAMIHPPRDAPVGGDSLPQRQGEACVVGTRASVTC